jgi:putative transposase
MKKHTEPLQADKIYHIYNRGINSEDLFKEHRNYNYFLQKYAQYIEPIAKTFAYCLLKNHFHIAIQTKTEEEIINFYQSKYPNRTTIPAYEKILSQQFSNLFNAYSQAINKSFSRTGGLFEEPFRRINVDDDTYFTTLIYYIHANPQKHGFVKDFKTYQHSSYQSFLKNNESKLQRKTVLDWFGGEAMYIQFHSNEIDDSLFDKIDIEN